jgi:hypothetical protein
MVGPGRDWNRFDLFELAAQDPPREARFLEAVHGGRPRRLADDFSGPGGIARAWVALSHDHEAVCVDIDGQPLEHARERAERDLRDAARRVSYHWGGVVEAPGRVDVIAALNFAAGELHTRPELMTYLRHALARLEAGGVLVLDTYGGSDAWQPGVQEVRLDTPDGAVVYEWEQIEADPLTARVRNAMHFRLPDGRRLDDAFEYDWRLWSVAELRDALREAGFRRTEVYTTLGDAIADDGRLLVHPDASDDPDAPHARIDGVEPFVAYVVGRTNA